MKGKILQTIFAISAVLIIAAPASAVGFATTGYTAATTSVANSVTAEYFTVNLYQYKLSGTPDEVSFTSETFNNYFEELDPTELEMGKITFNYSTDHSSKIIAIGSYDILFGNVYMVINGKSGVEYQPIMEIVLKKPDGSIISSEGLYESIVSLGNTTSALSINKAYKVTCSADFINTYSLSSGISTLTAEIVIGSVIVNENQGVFDYGCNATLVEHSTVVDNIEIETEGYDMNPTTVTTGGSSYNAVTIVQNSSGGSAQNGDIDVTMSITSGKHFIIQFTKAYTKNKTYKLTITVKIGNTTYNSGTIKMTEGGITRYYGLKSGSVTDLQGNISNQNYWFYSANSDIKVTIKDQNNDVDDSFKIRIMFSNND